jgi:hypothetical protein
VAASCERGDETSVSVKDLRLFDTMENCQFLENYDPWSKLILENVSGDHNLLPSIYSGYVPDS